MTDIKAEDIQITDEVDDPVINGIYIHLGDDCTIEEKIRLKQQILENQKTIKRLRERIEYQEYCPNRAEGKICDVCIFKDELQSILGDKK